MRRLGGGPRTGEVLSPGTVSPITDASTSMSPRHTRPMMGSEVLCGGVVTAVIKGARRQGSAEGAEMGGEQCPGSHKGENSFCMSYVLYSNETTEASSVEILLMK